MKGYVWEHLLIAEAALGACLPEKSEIHHVNGQRTDNDHANLVICEDHAYHMLLHLRGRAYAECGHPTWRRCYFCKQYDDPANMIVKRSAHHLSCRKAYERKRRLIAVLGVRLS